jgi:heat shock protein HslJ
MAIPPLVWQLTAFPGIATPIEPGRYTVQFVPDGTVAIRADCNWVLGNWTGGNGVLDLTVTQTTVAGCPSDSLEEPFVQALDLATTYALDATMGLTLTGPAGEMRFSPVLPAMASLGCRVSGFGCRCSPLCHPSPVTRHPTPASSLLLQRPLEREQLANRFPVEAAAVELATHQKLVGDQLEPLVAQLAQGLHVLVAADGGPGGTVAEADDAVRVVGLAVPDHDRVLPGLWFHELPLLLS